MEPVNDECEDAGKDRQRYSDGDDSCSENDNRTDGPVESISTRRMKPDSRDTRLVSEFRTLWILAR